jgi:hypothetical protein
VYNNHNMYVCTVLQCAAQRCVLRRAFCEHDDCFVLSAVADELSRFTWAAGV